MEQEFIKTYFSQNRLAQKSISIENVFDELTKMDASFLYQLKGASDEAINQLEAVCGFKIPNNYKYFLQKAGENLGKLKVERYYSYKEQRKQYLDLVLFIRYI